MADNKSTYSSLMHELVDVINEKANSSDSKNLEELVATAKTIVKPEGTLEITENKQYDVSGYELANVNVASSGGEVTITPTLGWQGTTVPNTGYVDKVYFNTNLSIEEINKVLSNLKYDSSGKNIVCGVANTSNGFVITKRESGYSIRNLEHWYAFYDSNTGWGTGHSNPMTVNAEISQQDLYSNGSVPNQNELLNSIISITPFELLIGEKVILEGDYDGTTIEGKSNVIDIKALIEQKKIPLNIIFSSSLKRLLDTTKSCNYMFHKNTTITDVDDFFEYNDTENVEQVAYMFNGCTKLVKLPNINLSKCKNFSDFCGNCYVLTEAILSETYSATGFYGAFQNCRNLKKVILNVVGASNFTKIFNGCTALTDLTLYSIAYNIAIGSGSSWGHLLTIESLLNCCQECMDVNAARTLTVGTENITKLSTIYVKITNPNETSKLPMVQCESTDEGAMLVADYMALKQWSLA